MSIDCSKCKDRGCCCGIMIFTKDFIDKHKDKIQVKDFKEIAEGELIHLFIDDGGCPFLNRATKVCEIYEDRPEICRRYGIDLSDNFKIACPYFKPNGNEWSEAMKKRIERHREHFINKVFKSVEHQNE
jgi:Fe-S-cluster containining protein